MTTTTTMRIRYTINDGNLVGNCEDLSADEVAARARRYRDLLDEAFRAEFGDGADIDLAIQYRTSGSSARPAVFADDPDADCMALEARAEEIARQTFERLIDEESAESEGWPHLTDDGQLIVREFAAAWYRPGGTLNWSAFYQEAEQAAANARPGEAIVYEIHSTESRDGRPPTITLGRELFE